MVGVVVVVVAVAAAAAAVEAVTVVGDEISSHHSVHLSPLYPGALGIEYQMTEWTLCFDSF